MTGDGVNDAPSLKRADTGIAVEGASDAARSAADIVFLAPGLGAIIDALKTSRQIFHRMFAYVMYRIALSLHLLICLVTWVAAWDSALPLTLVLFIAIFADIATLMIAYDNAPYSQSPVRWNLPKIWGIATLLGLILALGTIFLAIMIAPPSTRALQSALFLEICLTQSWTIFITRAAGRNWRRFPSWQLVLAVVIVNVLATVICAFGWFAVENIGTELKKDPFREKRDILRLPGQDIARVWVWSLFVLILMAVTFFLCESLKAFDRPGSGAVFSGRTGGKGRREEYEMVCSG